MSKPKTYPPYRITGSGADAYIVDRFSNDVLTRIQLSVHYNEVFSETIMQIICDALNKKEEQ